MKCRIPDLEVFLAAWIDNFLLDGRFVITDRVGRMSDYQFQVFVGDHEPPHFHVLKNGQKISSYHLSDGSVYRKFVDDKRVDKVVEQWYRQAGNRELAQSIWERSHSTNT